MRSGLILAIGAPSIPASVAFARNPEPPATIVQAPAARSFDYVRSRLDRRIPDMVARKIAESGDTGKIAAINRLARRRVNRAPLFTVFENGDIAAAFVNDPVRVMWAVRTIALFASWGTTDQKKRAEGIDSALEALKSDKLAVVFARNPETFVNIARLARLDTGRELEKLQGRNPEGIMASAIASHEDVAVELGRPLDDLRGREAERRAFLYRLAPADVLGLVCSEPSLFHQSSNNLLFDRLRQEFRGNFAQLVERYGIGDELARNAVLRAANSGRLPDFISEKDPESDMRAAIRLVLGSPSEKTGIYAESFDSKYYYLLALNVQGIARHMPQAAGIVEARIKRMRKPATREENMAFHALTYLGYLFSGNPGFDRELAAYGPDRSVFNRRDYLVAGRLHVLQVFDRKDTGSTHWGFSRKWFSRRFGNPRMGKSGEIIYERRGSQVVLFMGRDQADNARYASEWVAAHQAGVVTFRGHAASLLPNMPNDFFGNRKGKYVFIPGSCGSAGSVPGYLVGNPDTDISFFSYPSTGRGQVTNTLVDLLLEQGGPAEFSKILESGKRRIEAWGGDAGMIRVRTAGDGLFLYVAAKARD